MGGVPSGTICRSPGRLPTGLLLFRGVHPPGTNDGVSRISFRFWEPALRKRNLEVCHGDIRRGEQLANTRKWSVRSILRQVVADAAPKHDVPDRRQR